MKRIKHHYNLVAPVAFLLAAVIAHFFVPANYHLQNNTISDLAAQGYEYKAIMQVGLIGFGLVLIAGIVLNEINVGTTPLLLFGLGITLAGVVCTKPFFETISFSYSDTEVILHAIVKQVAAVAFCLSVLVQVFLEEKRSRKFIHFLFLAAFIGLAVTYAVSTKSLGLLDRGMYLLSCCWLAFIYKPDTIEEE